MPINNSDRIMDTSMETSYSYEPLVDNTYYPKNNDTAIENELNYMQQLNNQSYMSFLKGEISALDHQMVADSLRRTRDAIISVVNKSEA